MENEISNLGFLFFDALIYKKYDSVRSVYENIIKMSSDKNYRRTAKNTVISYEDKNPKNTPTTWQTSLFMSPEMSRLDEYLNASANKE